MYFINALLMLTAAMAQTTVDVPLNPTLPNYTSILSRSIPDKKDGQGPTLTPLIRAYQDSIAWFGENRDQNTIISLGFTLGLDYLVHPVSDLSVGIPSDTTVVLLPSNGAGTASAAVSQNDPLAQANLDAFVRAGGVLIVDMGDNLGIGGYIAPGATGTPDLIFPDELQCDDATLIADALGPDGILGTADDHPMVIGPDGVPGSADSLTQTNIDMSISCYVAHGNLEDGMTLPDDAVILASSTFGGEQKIVLAEYCLDDGLVILDTFTKEFDGSSTPPGVGPSRFLTNLLYYAINQGPAVCQSPKKKKYKKRSYGRPYPRRHHHHYFGGW